jgi:hypothetical protein
VGSKNEMGGSNESQMNKPAGIDIDSSDDLYVTNIELIFVLIVFLSDSGNPQPKLTATMTIFRI